MSGTFKEHLWFFFLFKLNFLEFCINFVADFENLHCLSHSNTSDSNEEDSLENSESKQDCLMNSYKHACFLIGNETSKVRNFENIEEERNASGNQAVIQENRLKSNFIRMLLFV